MGNYRSLCRHATITHTNELTHSGLTRHARWAQDLKGLVQRPGSPATTLQQIASMNDLYSPSGSPSGTPPNEDYYASGAGPGSAKHSPRLPSATAPSCTLTACWHAYAWLPFSGWLVLSSWILTQLDCGASTGRQSQALWEPRQSSGSMSRSASGMLPASSSSEPLSIQRSASAVRTIPYCALQLPCSRTRCQVRLAQLQCSACLAGSWLLSQPTANRNDSQACTHDR